MPKSYRIRKKKMNEICSYNFMSISLLTRITAVFVKLKNE